MYNVHLYMQALFGYGFIDHDVFTLELVKLVKNWSIIVTIKLYQLSERPSRILEMLQVLQGSHTVGYTEDRARYLNMLPGLANGTLNSSIHSRRVTSSALFSFDPCWKRFWILKAFLPELIYLCAIIDRVIVLQDKTKNRCHVRLVLLRMDLDNKG